MEHLRTWLKGERGRLKALSQACSVTHGAICQWTRVPAEKVPLVSKFTGISREELRPDLYVEAAE